MFAQLFNNKKCFVFLSIFFTILFVVHSVQAQIALTLEYIEEHRKKGTNFNKEFYRGDNWLQYALWQDLDVDIIQALLKGGANPSFRNGPSELEPLHIAAQETSYPEVITALISAGANPEVLDDLGNSPFLLASSFNKNPEVIRTLAQHSDVNKLDKKDLNAMHLAVIHKQSFEVIMTLGQIGVDSLAIDFKGRLPLGIAREIGLNEKVIAYMEGVYINRNVIINGSSCPSSLRELSQTNGH